MRVRTAGICTTEDKLEEIVGAYKEFDEFVFDVETRGPYRGRPERAQVAWISLAGPGRADVIPMGHINGDVKQRAHRKQVRLWNGDGSPTLTEAGRQRYNMELIPAVFAKPPKQLYPGTVFEALRPLFFSDRRKIGHNIKFDITSLIKYYDGEIIPPPYGDTAVLAHLLDESMGKYSLDYIIKKVYDAGYDDGKLGRTGIDLFSFYQVARYARLDAVYTWMFWRDFFDRLEPQGLMKVFGLEMDVLQTLIPMEATGAPIDMKAMGEIDGRLTERMETLRRALFKDAGKPWNLDNPVEKGWYVYTVRKHKPLVFTEKKQQPSTRAEDLERYAVKDEMVAAMVEYGERAKLKSTYVDGLRERLVEGRLHPSFLQWGTQTGRFSCTNPNLQNLPRVTEDRKDFEIRSMFVAPKGHVLIVADYSQIEYRLFAHFSRDPFMVRMFREGVDAHTAMAALITGKKPGDLEPEERVTYGKVVNFAIGFGGGVATLARQGVPEKRAKEILQRHREASPRFYEWKNRVIAEARSRRPPHVRTLLGRKRRLPTLFAADDKIRWKAERQAVNTRVQGSAADIIKVAMVRAHHSLYGSGVQPILTVHDELVSICPKGKEGWAEDTIRVAMEGACELRVPLLADINVCDRWSEGK
jgi:DNA polymerase I-like protein with 3'-5' exonuclease and polymerase domains